jgi:hypothetical protein
VAGSNAPQEDYQKVHAQPAKAASAESQRSGSVESGPHRSPVVAPQMQQWTSNNDRNFRREASRTVAVPLEIAPGRATRPPGGDQGSVSSGPSYASESHAVPARPEPAARSAEQSAPGRLTPSAASQPAAAPALPTKTSWVGHDGRALAVRQVLPKQAPGQAPPPAPQQQRLPTRSGSMVPPRDLQDTGGAMALPVVRPPVAGAAPNAAPPASRVDMRGHFSAPLVAAGRPGGENGLGGRSEPGVVPHARSDASAVSQQGSGSWAKPQLGAAGAAGAAVADQAGRSAVPPPLLVQSGHAASLTPY